MTLWLGLSLLNGSSIKMVSDFDKLAKQITAKKPKRNKNLPIV
jgi:hypothetical protein